jgi:hypothetical protein
MAKIAKAAVLDKPNGTFTIKEYPVPTPKPGTFILRTELAGICATDAHMYHGGLGGTAYPIILGHEFCGVIDQLGKGVTEDISGVPVKEGDRVIVIPGVGCGFCYYCAIAKTPTVCANIKAYGFMPDDAANVLAGGYAQYVYVQYANTAFLKTDLPANIAVLTEPVTIAIHGLNKVRPKIGTVAVVHDLWNEELESHPKSKPPPVFGPPQAVVRHQEGSYSQYRGAGDGIRTHDTLLGKQMRYHCATPAHYETIIAEIAPKVKGKRQLFRPTPQSLPGRGAPGGLRP